jgi:hypothetical protein
MLAFLPIVSFAMARRIAIFDQFRPQSQILCDKYFAELSISCFCLTIFCSILKSLAFNLEEALIQEFILLVGVRTGV